MTDQLKMESIRKWAAEHPEYNDFFATLRLRKRNARETELESFLKSESLQSESPTYATRRRAVEFFRGLAAKSLGEFRLGRRGSRTRFIWADSMIEVAQAAAGVIGETPEAGDEQVSGDVGAERRRTVTHQFVLRENFIVKFDLPLDFTPSEAERLSAMIKTLPLNAATKSENQ